MSSRDDASLIAESIAAAPAVEAVAPPLPESAVVSAPQAPAQPHFDDDTSLRHGRVLGKVLGLATRNITGKQLDDDLEKTAGDVFGEAFGLLGRFGGRMTYVGVFMGLVAIPLGVTGYWLWRSSAAKDVTPRGDE